MRVAGKKSHKGIGVLPLPEHMGFRFRSSNKAFYTYWSGTTPWLSAKECVIGRTGGL